MKILLPLPMDIEPALFNTAAPPVKVDAPNVHPPIVPDDDVKTPAGVTLNGAFANVAFPK